MWQSHHRGNWCYLAHVQKFSASFWSRTCSIYALLFLFIWLKLPSGASSNLKSTKKCVSLETMVRLGLAWNLMAVSLSIRSRSMASKKEEATFTVSEISLSSAQIYLNSGPLAFLSSTSILGGSLEARAAEALTLA